MAARIRVKPLMLTAALIYAIVPSFDKLCSVIIMCQSSVSLYPEDIGITYTVLTGYTQNPGESLLRYRE